VALMALFATMLLGTNAANADSYTLLRKIETALRSNNNLNGAAAYTTTPGVVVLYGTVFDTADSALAEKTVRNVKGVTNVINTLRTQTGNWQEEEARINDTLMLNGFNGVQAKVVGPQIYLSGQTTSEAEEQRAIRVVDSVSQLQVVNFMRAVPGPMFSTPSFF
jgi:osmotically-inducible protein OsmY